MAESPDESIDVEDVEEDSCHSQTSNNVPVTPDNDDIQRTFCCRKHRALFNQSRNSIRYEV